MMETLQARIKASMGTGTLETFKVHKIGQKAGPHNWKVLSAHSRLKELTIP